MYDTFTLKYYFIRNITNALCIKFIIYNIEDEAAKYMFIYYRVGKRKCLIPASLQAEIK